MSRIAGIVLAVAMAVSALAAVASAHPPEAIVPPEPLPSRILHVVAVDDKNASSPYPRDPYRVPLPLALAEDANVSAAPSVSASFRSQHIGPVCANSCGSRWASSALYNLGEDFQILPTETLNATLHVAWSYYKYELVDLTPDGPVGSIQVHASVGSREYAAESIPITPTNEDLVLPLSISRYDACSEDSDEPRACGHAHDNASEDEEAWAHDLVLHIEIFFHGDYDWYGADFGERLDVKIDTAGGSFLEVPIVVPEPVGVEAVEPVGASEADAEEIYVYEDPETGEVRFAPAPTLPLFAAAAVGLLALLRRRFA